MLSKEEKHSGFRYCLHAVDLMYLKYIIGTVPITRKTAMPVSNIIHPYLGNGLHCHKLSFHPIFISFV